MADLQAVRVDLWLWAARFYKTRSLAQTAVEGNKVRLNDLRPKVAKDVKIGDVVEVQNEGGLFTVSVIGLANKRGSAEIARTLYIEADESIAKREAETLRRREHHEPASHIFARPTKRDRRSLDRFTR